MNELPYPKWQTPLRELILEFDPEQFREKALKVEALIFERLRQLLESSNGHHERQAIDDGLSTLRSIRGERLS